MLLNALTTFVLSKASKESTEFKLSKTLNESIESELSKTNGDTSLISELRSAYENEKSIKKASLLSNYTD